MDNVSATALRGLAFASYRRGELTCEASRAWWIVPPRSALWIPGGVLHTIKARAPLEGYAVFLEPDRAPGPVDQVIEPLGKSHHAFEVSWEDLQRALRLFPERGIPYHARRGLPSTIAIARGVMSPWTKPRPWACASPRTSGRTIVTAFNAGIRPSAI